MNEQQKIQFIIQKIKDQNSKKELKHQEIVKMIDEELKDFKTNNKEDWQDHYIKERIKRNVIDHLKEKEEFKTSQTGKSLKWFKFYVYFRIPSGILLGFLSIFLLLKLENYPVSSVVFLVFNIFILIVLFLGLSNKDIWAWKFNFFVLIYETITISFNAIKSVAGLIGEDFLAFGFLFNLVIGGLIWLLPNWIYFKKRKYLFS